MEAKKAEKVSELREYVVFEEGDAIVTKRHAPEVLYFSYRRADGFWRSRGESYSFSEAVAMAIGR